MRSLAITAALGVSLVSAAPAVAGGGSGHTILRDTLEGTFPLTDTVNPSPPVAGIPPGGAPWELDENSRVRVREDGRITVVVKGLVIPGRVPPNPVGLMVATLVCGDTIADTTRSFAVSPDGDGRISDRIDVPEHCDDPVVLVRNVARPPTSTIPDAFGAYFAATTDGDGEHGHD